MYSKNRLSVVLIEDNMADANLTKMYLEESSQKLDIYHCESLFEGVQLIESKSIDLALLDLSLPDTSGFKTLTKYLERVPHIPVVVLTGINNEIIGNQAVKAGAQDFLVKGQFDAKLLGRVIRYSLQRFQEMQKLEDAVKGLAISEKRFEEAQKMAHFGNWQMDLVTNVMDWTDEAFRIFGFQPGSLSPTLSDYLDYVQKEDRDMVENFFENVAKDGKQQKMEHRIITNGHTLKYVALQAKIFFEELTEKIMLVGSIQDISERKLKEQLIVERNIGLKTAKIKEETIANMSFHIRTPLSSIVNLLYVLETTHLTTQQKEFVGGLHTSIDDLSLMMNNLLNFSVLAFDNIKIEEEEFNVSDLARSIRKVLQAKADTARQKVVLNIQPNMPEMIVSDPRKLNQIVHNLMENAIMHTGKGGKVVVNLKIKDKDFRPYLYLSVEDTGRGLTAKQIKEMLDSERSLETFSNEKDSGSKKLGVAIVSKLSSIMGGQLSINSKEGQGSIFSVEMPVKIVRQQQVTADNATSMAIKILLVEDHFLNQIATKKVLTAWHPQITVDIAENGLVAVEKFREYGYDIILMDIQMPIMDGIEATGIIRQKSQVPIVALTANASRQEADRCIAAGCTDFLPKPFKPTELYNKILNVLAAAKVTADVEEV
jgi:CheY-like chemotaxis protein